MDKGGIGPVHYPSSRMCGTSSHERMTSNRRAAWHSAGPSSSTRAAVRHQVVNDIPLGRNIDEMLRMVDALQFNEEHGEVCPAGWTKERPGMKDTASGVATYLAAHAKEL